MSRRRKNARVLDRARRALAPDSARLRLAARARRALAILCVPLGWAGAGWAETPQDLRLLGAEPFDSEAIVSELEWAAQLVDALGLGGALADDHAADDLFTLLCADRAELVTDAAGHRVPARPALKAAFESPPAAGPGEPVRVVLSVPASAIYALEVAGSGVQHGSIDRRPVGELDLSPLGRGQAPALVPLRAGPHEVSLRLARGARVDRIELDAYRPLCVAPAGGWDADRKLSFGAKARTLVRAFRLEQRLPAVGEGVLIEGEHFSAVSGGGREGSVAGSAASGGAAATAPAGPAEFTYRLRLARPGLFTLMARVRPSGAQLWSIDGRYRVALAPEAGASEFNWSHVMTLTLGSGEHAVRALVPRGSGIDVLRLVRRRASDADYIALLDQLGFREGAPDALVRAADARANLTNPNFDTFVAGFLQPVGGNPGDPLALVARELDQLYSRPLSPVIPPEL